MTTRTLLGKYLATYRIENDISLRGMAKELGFSPAYLSALEYGKKHVTVSLVKKLCKLNAIDKDSVKATSMSVYRNRLMMLASEFDKRIVYLNRGDYE